LGINVRRAISAFQRAHQLTSTGRADCGTWKALTGGDDAPLTTTYRITEEDANGPFTTAIPRELDQQSSLPALGYASVEELLGERFHVAPALLRHLNRGAAFKAGAEIIVPAVTPFGLDAKPTEGQAGITVEVSREDSS